MYDGRGLPGTGLGRPTPAPRGHEAPLPILQITSKMSIYGDFPGGPVAKTLHSQCRGPRFDPWSGN